MSPTESQCLDDKDFHEDDTSLKVLYMGRRSNRWGNLDNQSGSRAFEFCRRTCGYCACEDDRNFDFNGLLDCDCDWVAKNRTPFRCAIHEYHRELHCFL